MLSVVPELTVLPATPLNTFVNEVKSLLLTVCVSEIPMIVLAGAANDTAHALPFEFGIPAPGYTIPPPLPLHADPLHSTTPVPLETRLMLMFVSDPVAATLTVAGLPVAAFVTVTPSTAAAVGLTFKKGFPRASVIVSTDAEVAPSGSCTLPLKVVPDCVSPVTSFFKR